MAESKSAKSLSHSLAESLDAMSPALGMVSNELGGVATDTFDAYSATMEQAVATGHASAAGIGKAMKASAKTSLTTLGQQALVKGLFEVGYGLKAFATGDSDGGGKHMTAAAVFMGVSALAGGGASVLGGTHGGGKGKREEVEPAGARSDGSTTGRVIQTITVIGNPTETQTASSPRHHK